MEGEERFTNESGLPYVQKTVGISLYKIYFWMWSIIYIIIIII